MNYRIYFSLLLFGSVFVQVALAQEQEQTACAQSLRTARAVYDDGRLHELPALLSACITQGSKEEKVEALKLLTLTYIYLGEPLEADNHMVLLLKADPFFQINQAVDPAEFINLYNQFRTTPLFNIGLFFGINHVQNSVINTHYVFPNGAGQGSYTGNISISLGLSFEKKLNELFTINPELVFTSRSFSYNNTDIIRDINDQVIENSGISAQYAQSWIDGNLLLQINLFQKKESTFYALIGPGMQYMTNNFAEVETRTGTQVVSGPSIDLLSTNNRLNYHASIGAGARFRIGSVYFRPDIRYMPGFTNITNASARQQNESEAVLRYGLPLNDYRNSTIMLNVVAIMYPYFNPKKKKIKE